VRPRIIELRERKVTFEDVFEKMEGLFVFNDSTDFVVNDSTELSCSKGFGGTSLVYSVP
jgi:hypothetical protein